MRAKRPGAKRPGANGNRGETTRGKNGIRGETTRIRWWLHVLCVGGAARWLSDSSLLLSSLTVCSNSKFLDSSCWHRVSSTIFSFRISNRDLSLTFSCSSTLFTLISLFLSSLRLSFVRSFWFCSLVFGVLDLGVGLGLVGSFVIVDASLGNAFS